MVFDLALYLGTIELPGLTALSAVRRTEELDIDIPLRSESHLSMRCGKCCPAKSVADRGRDYTSKLL